MKSLPRLKKHLSRFKHEWREIWLKERILKPGKDKFGYLHYRLSRDGEHYLIKAAHLVAEAFLGYDRSQYDRHNPESLVVIHKNYRRDDNSVSNLKIMTLYEAVGRQYDRERKNHQ